MQTLITTSGFTIIPPTGVNIVSHSVQLAVTASGNVRVSGSLGTLNSLLYSDGYVIPMEVVFLPTESVTVTPSAGSAIFNYIYSGEPDGLKYYQAAIAYSAASGVQKWPTVVQSGSYAPVSGGFGG